jgi:hypothetical protein
MYYVLPFLEVTGKTKRNVHHHRPGIYKKNSAVCVSRVMCRLGSQWYRCLGEGCSCRRTPRGGFCSDGTRWFPALRNECKTGVDLKAIQLKLPWVQDLTCPLSFPGSYVVWNGYSSTTKASRRGRKLSTRQGAWYSVFVHVLCNKSAVFDVVTTESHL